MIDHDWASICGKLAIDVFVDNNNKGPCQSSVWFSIIEEWKIIKKYIEI